MAEILSMATLLVSVATLLATAMSDDPSLRRLVWTRCVCAGAATLLVAAGLPGLVSGFALGVACIAALLSALAIRRALRTPGPSLETYLDRLTADGDAAWQAEFERPFDEYVRERPRC